jgi:hypothetical protein
VNAPTSYIPGAHDRLLRGKAEKVTGGTSPTLRRFAYSHDYL